MRHCSRDPRHHRQHRVVIGIFMILAGVLALAGKLLHLDIGSAWDYWPMLFCLAGILKLMHSRRSAGLIVGLGMLLLGGGWTLQNLGLVHDVMPLILSVLLILAGIVFILRASGRRDAPTAGHGRFTQTQAHDDVVSINATMSGAAVRCDAQDFKGGELRAVLGGIKLDLRQARLSANAELHVYAVCGGIEIRIPQEWTLTIKVSPLMGSVEDKTVPPSLPTGTLVLSGESIMGGIEIKN